MGDQPMKSILAAMQEAYGNRDVEENLIDLLADAMNDGLVDVQDLERIVDIAEMHHRA